MPTDPEEVATELIAMYEAIFGTTVQPASPERLFIQYVAAAIIQERVQNNYTGNQNIPILFCKFRQIFLNMVFRPVRTTCADRRYKPDGFQRPPKIADQKPSRRPQGIV